MLRAEAAVLLSKEEERRRREGLGERGVDSLSSKEVSFRRRWEVEEVAIEGFAIDGFAIDGGGGGDDVESREREMDGLVILSGQG